MVLRLKCWTCWNRLDGQRWWLAGKLKWDVTAHFDLITHTSLGTTLTLASAAGCQELTSTPSRALRLFQTGQGLTTISTSLLEFGHFQSDFRAVAVVVDPIQSVKGKVVIDAFRLINPNMMVRRILAWYYIGDGSIARISMNFTHLKSLGSWSRA